MFQDKKILLAITGSIAAYKSILLTRLLVKAGAEVKIVMTPAPVARAKTKIKTFMLDNLYQISINTY